MYKGEFELTRKLKKPENLQTFHSILGSELPKRNVLAHKLSEIRDIPRIQKLAIFGEGSILGEEDLLKRESYSCTLTCHSPKGTLYKISSEMFELLRQNEPSWDQIAIQAKIKEFH